MRVLNITYTPQDNAPSIIGSEWREVSPPRPFSERFKESVQRLRDFQAKPMETPLYSYVDGMTKRIDN